MFSELQGSDASRPCATQIIGVSLEFHIKTMGIEENHSSEFPRKILQHMRVLTPQEWSLMTVLNNLKDAS